MYVQSFYIKSYLWTNKKFFSVTKTVSFKSAVMVSNVISDEHQLFTGNVFFWGMMGNQSFGFCEPTPERLSAKESCRKDGGRLTAVIKKWVGVQM